MAIADAHRLIPGCRISVDGKKLALEKEARLTRVDVDLDANLFGRCVLLFNDPNLALIDGADFLAGSAVQVELGFASKMGAIFSGEVVALEPEFRRDRPPSLRVVCLESIHRLALQPKTRALMQVDDKEIVTRIAQEHGLTAEAPSGSKEHLLQGNVSDAVLLRRVAQKSGNQVRIEGKKLIVGPPAKGAQITIQPGDGLKKMRLRIKSATQVSEVTIHGWDAKAKREIVGKARAEGETGEGSRDHGGGASLAFAGHEHTPADVATAEAMAKGRMRKLAEGFVTAQVEMIGNTGLLPGAELTFEKIDAGLDGKYRLESAHHEFSKHGYFTTFRAVRIGKKKPPAPAPAPQKKEEKKPEQAAEAAKAPRNLEVQVVDQAGAPQADVFFSITLPDGSTRTGRTDADGFMRMEIPMAGRCHFRLPDLDVSGSA